MMDLTRIQFLAHDVASGGRVPLAIEWTSDQDGTLYLNYDASRFVVSPDAIPLPISGAGILQVHITFTRKAAPGDCDIHFAFGPCDPIDWVSVT